MICWAWLTLAAAAGCVVDTIQSCFYAGGVCEKERVIKSHTDLKSHQKPQQWAQHQSRFHTHKPLVIFSGRDIFHSCPFSDVAQQEIVCFRCTHNNGNNQWGFHGPCKKTQCSHIRLSWVICRRAYNFWVYETCNEFMTALPVRIFNLMTPHTALQYFASTKILKWTESWEEIKMDSFLFLCKPSWGFSFFVVYKEDTVQQVCFVIFTFHSQFLKTIQAVPHNHSQP